MLEITVKTLDSQNHSFTCEDDITVHGFKEHIADTVSVPVESQRLIYCGRVLQDDKKLNDYDVNGKVIHLVQRAPPQPTSRSSSSDRQRSSTQGWTLGSPRVGLHRNVYMGAMAVPTEVVETHGLPTPQLSNTLSNSRLVTARSMLEKVTQLMDRMDDPSVPLHPSPTENNASESTQPQPSAPEEEQLDQGSANDSSINARDRVLQVASEMAAAFSAAALINVTVSNDNNEDGSNAGLSNSSDANQSNQSTSNEMQQQEESSTQHRPSSQAPEQQRQDSERSESEIPDSSRSSNDNDEQNGSSRRSPPVPRPPLMAELLDTLLRTQDRMRPYIERYRTLMATDPSLSASTGPESAAENQRIVDGVSESLHFLSHASHALSDIIVDMAQQPPRNLRCRPIIIQHSTILQAGIPIQVESRINLNRNTTANNNNTTDGNEGNEATRPASPVQAPRRRMTRSNSANNQSTSPSANGSQGHASLLGTLLLPSNVEVSMELSPPSAMDFNSPSATDGSDTEPGQTNNNNNNNGNGGLLGATSNSLRGAPLALIREALRSVINETQSQAETSAGASINLPFVMDLGTPNSGQSTQARSNIGTHPTTSTQTRSTARPHVLHPQSNPLNMGMGMGHNYDFDPFLPCYSHHVRRTPSNSTNSTSTSTSRTNRQSNTSASHSRSQSASRASSTSARIPLNFTVGGDSDVTRDFLENESQAIASGVGLAMTLGGLLQGATNSGDVHISLIGGSNTGEIRMAPSNDTPILELLRSFNVRPVDFGENRTFLLDLWLFLLRNLTVSNLLQLGLGQSDPLIRIRRPLREFLEQSFPSESGANLQKQIVDQFIEQVVAIDEPYLQILVSAQVETASRRVDIPATIQALLRSFLEDFVKALFSNDYDDAQYAERVKLIARKLEEQSSAVLQYILGGRTALESVVTRVFNQITEGTNPIFQQFMADMMSSRLRSFTSQNWTRPQEELSPLLVFVDERPTPSSSESTENKRKADPEPQFRVPISPTPTPSQKVQQKHSQQGSSFRQEKKSESTPMEVDKSELDLVLSNVVEDDPKDLANGEEVQETFPGSENVPTEWVPIMARDQIRQRRQVQVQNLQGGPIPFSDAYLSCMPSKRRKLIEQQKPQLLVTPTPANANAIAASVERLVRDGMTHSQIEEVEGAAHAVAAAPEVRTAFGQAIKDCLHPSRLQSQDFPNSRRFPNASRYFGDESKDDSASTTNGSKK